MTAKLKRREFITLLGGAAVWPVGATSAQKPAMPVIGLLGTTSREADARLAPFRQTLQQAGYFEQQKQQPAPPRNDGTSISPGYSRTQTSGTQ